MTTLLGLQPYSALSASGTPAPTLIKGTAGQLADIALSNNGAGAAYVKFYDAATADAVNVGGLSASTPVLRFQVPAGATLTISTKGLGFLKGIVWAITGGAADDDTTAVTAAQVLMNVSFL